MMKAPILSVLCRYQVPRPEPMVPFPGHELGAALGAREGGEPGPGTVTLKQALLPMRVPLATASDVNVSGHQLEIEPFLVPRDRRKQRVSSPTIPGRTRGQEGCLGGLRDQEHWAREMIVTLSYSRATPQSERRTCLPQNAKDRICRLLPKAPYF